MLFSFKVNRRTIIFTIAAIVLMLFYFSTIGIDAVINELIRINILIILAIILVQLTQYFLDSLAWKLFLQTVDIRFSSIDIYSIYLASFGYGLLIPSMSAVETALRVNLSKNVYNTKNNNQNPIDSSAVLSSIVLHKMVGVLVNIPFNLVIAYSLVVYFDFPASWGLFFMIITSIIIGGMITIIVSISLSPKTSLSIMEGVLHGFARILPPLARRQEAWGQKLEKFTWDYHTNFKYLALYWKTAILAGFLIFLMIILSWFNLYLLIVGLSVDVDLLAMIAVNFMGATLNSLPLGIPGMEGIKEVLVSESLRKFINTQQSGAVALLYSFTKFYVPVSAAILIGFLLGVKIDQEK